MPAEDSENSDRSYAINSIKVREVKNKKFKKHNKDWVEEIKINERQIQFKIDTGANSSVITRQECQELGVVDKIKPRKIIIESYGGFEVEAIGEIKLKIGFKNRWYKEKFIVIKKNYEKILGLEASEELGIVKREKESKVNLI